MARFPAISLFSGHKNIKRWGSWALASSADEVQQGLAWALREPAQLCPGPAPPPPLGPGLQGSQQGGHSTVTCQLGTCQRLSHNFPVFLSPQGELSGSSQSRYNHEM